MFRHLRPLLGLAFVLLTAVPVAQAQYHLAGPQGDPSEADMRRARDAFVRGSEQIEQGRWSDGLVLFEESYRLSGVSAALFNAATTLRSLGRHRDARDAFRQLLGDHADLDPAVRAEAETRLGEEQGRVAVLTLAGVPQDPAIILRLDDLEVDLRQERPIRLEADPGHHAVRVELLEHHPWLWEGNLGDGQREELDVILERLPEPETIIVRESSIIDSPIFWIVAGAVLVAGSATAGYFIMRDDILLEPENTAVHL